MCGGDVWRMQRVPSVVPMGSAHGLRKTGNGRVSVVPAESWCILARPKKQTNPAIPAKQKPPRKRATRQRRKKESSAALPAPVEVASVQPEKSGGFLSGFTSKPAPAPSPSLIDSSPSSISEGLSAEAENLLAGVPDVIGETGGVSLPSSDPDEAGAGDDLTPALGAEIIDAEQMQGLIVYATGVLADVRKFEPWRIGDGPASLLAKPYAQLVNGAWRQFAPVLLSQMCEKYPGLFAALSLSAVIFGPIAMADFKHAMEEKKQRRVIINNPRDAQAAPAPAAHNGLIWNEGQPKHVDVQQ